MRKPHAFALVHVELNQIPGFQTVRQMCRLRVSFAIEESKVAMILTPDHRAPLIVVIPKYYAVHASPNSKRHINLKKRGTWRHDPFGVSGFAIVSRRSSYDAIQRHDGRYTASF